MQTRPNEFTLEPINNIMMGSIFGRSVVIAPPTPQITNAFLLSTGSNFLLSTGSEFLLSG